MPQPSQTDVHLDSILTQISVAYIQEASNFVSTQVFPQIPVDKQSDKYYVYTKGDWFRDEAAKRADSTESVGSGYTLGTGNYFADVYAFHKDIGDQVRANTDSPLDADRDATQFVTQRMLLRQEIQWNTDYFGSGIWGTDVTPGALWGDYATSDPIEDIELGKETILGSTGFMPNTLVLGYQVFRKLKNHPDVIDRIKYTSAVNGRTVTADLLAGMFDVDRVLISKSIKNTAAEGATTAMSFVSGKNALLCYVNPNPGILQPSAGYQFVWRGVSDGLGTNVGISRFRMDPIRADRIEAQMAWDNKIIASDLGYMFNSVVA